MIRTTGKDHKASLHGASLYMASLRGIISSCGISSWGISSSDHLIVGISSWDHLFMEALQHGIIFPWGISSWDHLIMDHLPLWSTLYLEFWDLLGHVFLDPSFSTAAVHHSLLQLSACLYCCCPLFSTAAVHRSILLNFCT